MKKLRLNKEVISNISKNEMNNLKGGYEQEFWGSRIFCNTVVEPGGGCHKSKSCDPDVWICIPI